MLLKHFCYLKGCMFCSSLTSLPLIPKSIYQITFFFRFLEIRIFTTTKILRFVFSIQIHIFKPTTDHAKVLEGLVFVLKEKYNW